MNSETYCAIPWTSLYLSSTGGWAPCCVSRLQIPGSPQTAFLSPEIQKVREDLLLGVKSPSCKSCWKKEEMNGRSMRQGYAEILSQSPISHEGRLEEISYLDVSFSSICNLKCRFCGPDRSSRWVKEANELRAKDPSFWNQIFATFNDFPLPSPDELLEFILKLPALHTININGGEPFADSRHKEFLQKLIESGRAEHLRLLYTTNGTRAPEAELQLLHHFKSVEVMFSIEGTGALYRYIRGDQFSLEDRIQKNIFRFSRIPGVRLGIHSTMSIYSTWDMKNIYDWKLKMEEEL